jgi:hypothetical protein
VSHLSDRGHTVQLAIRHQCERHERDTSENRPAPQRNGIRFASNAI